MERTDALPTILVVEDYLDSRQMLRLLLEGIDYRVLTADNANDALDLTTHSHIDLVLTDYGLPDMTGLELVERLRKLGGDFQSIPIVMLTAFDGDEFRNAAEQVGCDAFFVKPADCDRLSETIRCLLNHEKIEPESLI